LPIGKRQGARIVELVFGTLVIALPADDAGGVAVDDPVSDRLFHDPDQDGQAVFDRGPTALLGDPAVNGAIDGPVGDHAQRQVPECGHDPFAPSGQVGIEGLALQAAQGQRHDGVAVHG
jgi:hypothetical protein